MTQIPTKLIKVYEVARNNLKVQAAKEGIEMQDLASRIIGDYIHRYREGTANKRSIVHPPTREEEIEAIKANPFLSTEERDALVKSLPRHD